MSKIKAIEILKELHKDVPLETMENFDHHNKVTTYQHSLYVVSYSVKLSKYFNNIDIDSLVKGAMLHDFFGYDWKEFKKKKLGNHAKIHPLVSVERASKYIKLDNKTKNIIEAHMWPKNILVYPKSKEAWIVCLADKVCAIREFTSILKHLNDIVLDVK